MSLRLERFCSVVQVPTQVWDSLAPRARVCLESAHLAAIEASGINDLRPYYFIGYDGEVPVGIAYCSAFEIDLATLRHEVPERTLEIVRKWYPRLLRFRMLEVGVISALGTAIAVKDDHFHAFLSAFADGLDELGERERADFALIRDIELSDVDRFRTLEGKGYRGIAGFPTTRLALRWESLDGYLASLKAKKRQLARKRLDQLSAPGISVQVIYDYGRHAERLALLWNEVSRRAEAYQHEKLSAAYFRELSRRLGERSYIVAILREQEIIGYILCLEGDEEIHLAFVGLDYGLRDTYALYFNLHLHALRVALEHRKQRVDLGITTYDPKMRLGCELSPSGYFVKHLKRPALTPALADLIGSGLEQPDNCHHVFADRGSEEARLTPQEVKAILNPPQARRDVTTKVRDIRADTLRILGLYAFCPPFQGAQEPLIEFGGRTITMLGTNSYLGLATHLEVKAAAKAAIDKYGTGCSGSPILNGTLDIHQELAGSLARFMQKDDALLCSTGYQTNFGVVSALLGRHDVAILDERSHASLIDGARQSGATLLRYAHNDMDDLERKLESAGAAPKLILVDALFSMEGTLANLPEIVRLKKEHGARLMVDESHALGVLGPGGRGAAEHFGVLEDVDIAMGTFSKSLAAQGGFVAASTAIVEGLRHRVRPHMFSASLTPPTVATVQKALEILIREPERRRRVLGNARYLADGMRALGYDTAFKGGPVIPLVVGEELLALALFHKLLAEGVFVNPVLYPAVPKGGEMLRITPMATCSREILDDALRVFAKIRTSSFPRAEASRSAERTPPRFLRDRGAGRARLARVAGQR